MTLDDDVAAAVDRLLHDRSIGVSQAIDELVRARLGSMPARTKFRQRGLRLGLGIDVRNVAETLDLLEGPRAR
ncbi:MAG TPA: hypothetical protein VG435_06535 [Acidimicrobiales bacterium]|nr:hypothetical protein [Acidimicrobiales bacterium]